MVRRQALPAAGGVRYTQRSERGMAQPGSALAWGARGRGFESRCPDNSVISSSGLRSHTPSSGCSQPGLLILGGASILPQDGFLHKAFFFTL